MNDLVQRFALYCREELELKETTVDQYLCRLRYLSTYFGKPIEKVTSDDLRALKREKPWASGTVASRITAYKSFHVWGSLEGLWSRNGVMDVKGPRVTNERTLPLEPWEARRILDACRRPLDFRLAYLGLYAGMRRVEIARFSGDQWEGEWLWFRGAKNDEMRRVPVHPELAEVKWKVLACPPTYVETLQRVKKRLHRVSEVAFRIHQLRSTFTQAMEDRDVPDEVKGGLLGHQDSVTGRYRLVNRRRLRDAVHAVSYFSGGEL